MSVPPDTAPSFKPPTFADDTVMYVFGPAYRNPFITSPEQPDGADISRSAVEFKHIDAWKYGHNLVEIVIKKSSDVEPAAGGGTGAMGFYSIFRSGLGLNRLVGRPIVALGPLRDLDIQAGMNLEPRTRTTPPTSARCTSAPTCSSASDRASSTSGCTSARSGTTTATWAGTRATTSTSTSSRSGTSLSGSVPPASHSTASPTTTRRRARTPPAVILARSSSRGRC